ncbi:MAG: MotA/TolQ/ExbB proton channel family protein [Thermodesulfobacteriota bacterium]|nr:MotA/TolQ/ExbB proton channel family protein [Thermodesulfobacteriota bacterium]
MDIATVIGLLGGGALILSAVLLGGSALVFINISGLLIVAGGTIATSFIKFSMKDVINSIAVVMKAFFIKIDAPDEIIKKMVHFSSIARKEGLIALDKEKSDDGFTAKALRYLADGYDEGLIEEILSKDVKVTVQRHTLGQNVFKGMGASAPAFGMIGTLIGLVQMLSNMSDPKSIGPAMAVALLTTLYGALIANLICLPLADKLALRSEEEQVNKTIIIQGALGISKALNPRILWQWRSEPLAPTPRTYSRWL